MVTIVELMKMNNLIQAKCKELGMSYKDMALLEYIRRTYIYTDEYHTSDIYNDNILCFNSSTDVKESLEKIEECGLWAISSYTRGKFTLDINKEVLKGVYTNESVVVVKRQKKEKVKGELLSPEENDIIEYYKTFDVFPKLSSLTQRRKVALNDSLSKYSVSDIKDALLYASEQEWLKRHLGALWYDFGWLLINIDKFMEGGKYRYNKKPKEIEVPFRQSDVNIIL